MRTMKLLLQYDGTAYHGWQRQRNAVTIQEIVEDKIAALTGEHLSVIAASRTDAGVHALEQVASFRTGSPLPADTIRRALNATLPSEIRVTDAEDVADDFHPRYQAKGKRYFYLVAVSRIQSPFLQRYVWSIPYALDVNAMRASLHSLEGNHDFSSFRGSGCGAATAVRTLYRVDMEELNGIDFMTATLPGKFIRISLKADAFLRHMVRNIVGTLVDIGRGERSHVEIDAIINARDRRAAGPTAPAKGLFLERIYY
jgi:tRNA pseudouridine38-40 synthase